MKPFAGRLGLQQRVLPAYRIPFFDLLAESCEGGLGLFAGFPRPGEMIAGGEPRFAQVTRARNLHLFDGPLYLCHQRGFTGWLKAWDPDALVLEANPRYTATPSAIRWMHARGRRVIGWGLGSPPVDGIRKRRRLGFIRQFDALISYSRRGAEEYAALGFPRERIFVAHNSVSASPSEKPERSPLTGQPVILFVGRLQERKRIDHLIRACSEIGSNPRLVIVGDGPQRASLESLARRVYPAAEFIGGKHGDGLKPYFVGADLFVLPGTGGLAVQEAMSYGLPVIVAKGDGTQDDLVREGNGWQIAAEEYAALVGTMKEALSDAPRLRSMGDESFRIVSEEINIQRMVEVFMQALKSL